MKDLWFAEFEKAYNENLDKGMSDKKAYDKAAEMAEHRSADRLADMIDEARMRKKDANLS